MNLEIDEGSGLHHGQADSFVPPRWCPSMPASWWLQGWSRGLMNTGCRDSNFIYIYIYVYIYTCIYIYTYIMYIMYVVWYPLEGALRFFEGEKTLGNDIKLHKSLPFQRWHSQWRSLARRRHKFASRLGRPGRPVDLVPGRQGWYPKGEKTRPAFLSNTPFLLAVLSPVAVASVSVVAVVDDVVVDDDDDVVLFVVAVSILVIVWKSGFFLCGCVQKCVLSSNLLK